MPKIKPLNWKDLEKIFIASGFRFVRQEGNHRSTKTGISRPIVIPTHEEVAVSIKGYNRKYKQSLLKVNHLGKLLRSMDWP